MKQELPLEAAHTIKLEEFEQLLAYQGTLVDYDALAMYSLCSYRPVGG